MVELTVAGMWQQQTPSLCFPPVREFILSIQHAMQLSKWLFLMGLSRRVYIPLYLYFVVYFLMKQYWDWNLSSNFQCLLKWSYFSDVKPNLDSCYKSHLETHHSSLMVFTGSPEFTGYSVCVSLEYRNYGLLLFSDCVVDLGTRMNLLPFYFFSLLWSIYIS